MQSPESCVTVSCPITLIADEDEEVADMETSVKAVEEILNYKFIKPKLLEEALTHSSCIDSVSYRRLEFVGDAALGLAIINYIYFAYPELDKGQLSLLRSANVSNEKLARVAVRHGLYKYVRRNTTPVLDEKVKEFVTTVQQEEQLEFYGGAMKAPKVLANIVESVAAAVYVDCGFDLKNLWLIFEGLLKPIITLDLLEKQPQPVSFLYELCQKVGKKPDVRCCCEGEKYIVSIYVNDQFISSASSENQENAKLRAAKAALHELADKSTGKTDTEVEPNTEIDGAKQKLHNLCGKKKWPIPTYSIEDEIGPAHDKRFIYSAKVQIPEGFHFVKGEEKSRKKDAENSAALAMICHLQDCNLRESSLLS